MKFIVTDEGNELVGKPEMEKPDRKRYDYREESWQSDWFHQEDYDADMKKYWDHVKSRPRLFIEEQDRPFFKSKKEWNDEEITIEECHKCSGRGWTGVHEVDECWKCNENGKIARPKQSKGKQQEESQDDLWYHVIETVLSDTSYHNKELPGILKSKFVIKRIHETNQ